MSNTFDDGGHNQDPAYGPPAGPAYGQPPEAPAYGPPAYGPPQHSYWAPHAGQPHTPGAPYQAAPGARPEVANHRVRNWVIFGGIGVAVVLVIGVVAAVTLRTTAPETGTQPRAAEAPQVPGKKGATTCTHSESSGELPTTDSVFAGGLSFPLSVAPDWERKPEHRVPNSIDAVSLTETVSETDNLSWIGQITVGITNFDQSLSLEEQAKLMVKCVVDSELYDSSSPRVGEVTAVDGRLDGVPTSTIDVPVSVTIADPTIRGDDLVVVVVGTSPTTYFLGSSPIGDADRRAVVEAAMEKLHLSAL